MQTAWSRPTKYVVSVALAILGLYLFYLFSRSVLTLLILAALIAFLVRPAIRLLHRRLRLPYGPAVLLTYLGVVILIILAPLFLIPPIVDAIQFVSQLDYKGFVERTYAWLNETLIGIRDQELPLAALDDYIDRSIDTILNSLGNASVSMSPEPPSVSSIVESLGSAVTVTFGVAAGLVGSVFSSVVLFIFMILSSIYMSLGAPRYRMQFMRLIPPAHQPEITILLNRLGHIWVAFFRGQFSLMIIIGVVTWLGLTLLGVPGAVSLGIIAGLLEVIPNLGPIVAAIPAVIVALLQGSTTLPISNLAFALLIILFYWLIQNLENSIIVPKVLGEAVDLPPLVVMSGVLVAASVGGIVGALLATPIIASGRELVQYAYRKILGDDPFPPEEQPTSAGAPVTAEDVARVPPPPQPAADSAAPIMPDQVHFEEGRI